MTSARTLSIRRPSTRSTSSVASSAQWMSSTTSTDGGPASSSDSVSNTSCGGGSRATSSRSLSPELPPMSTNALSGRGAASASQAPSSTTGQSSADAEEQHTRGGS